MQHVFEGQGAPTEAPTALGQHYIDTTTGTHYNSVGTTSVEDWKAGGGGGGEVGPVKTIINAQAHLLSEEYLDWLKGELIKYLPPNMFNPDGTFIDSEVAQGFEDEVSWIAGEHAKYYSSGVHIDLTRGTRHIHNVKTKESSKWEVGQTLGLSQFGTCDVFPIARMDDIYTVVYNKNNTVFWSQAGDIWVSDNPSNPDQWNTEHLRLILEEDDALQHVGINDAGYVFAVSAKGRLYYGRGGRYMDEITDWTERGITDTEKLPNALGYGNGYAGAEAGHFFIMGQDRTILFTPDSGSTWKFVDVDLSILETTSYGYRGGEALVYQGSFYYIVHEFSQGDTIANLAVLKFDSTSHTWSVVHRTEDNYSFITAYTAAGGTRLVITDDRGGSVSDAAEGLQTTDGVTFTKVDLTDTSYGVYFNFSEGKFVEIGNATYRCNYNGIIHRSVDGLHWDYIGNLNHDNGSGFLALPHKSPVTDVNPDDCACFISYSRTRGFKLWAYEPGQVTEGFNKTVPWFQGGLDVYVFTGQALNGYDYDTDAGEGGWLPANIGPGMDGGSNNAAFDMLEYGLILQMSGLPFGIDHRLINVFHFVDYDDLIMQSMDAEKILTPARNGLLDAQSDALSETKPAIGIPSEVTMSQSTVFMRPEAYTPILGGNYVKESPDDIYMKPNTNDLTAFNLTFSTYAFNIFATCAIKAEEIPLTPRMNFAPR